MGGKNSSSGVIGNPPARNGLRALCAVISVAAILAFSNLVADTDGPVLLGGAPHSMPFRTLSSGPLVGPVDPVSMGLSPPHATTDGSLPPSSYRTIGTIPIAGSGAVNLSNDAIYLVDGGSNVTVVNGSTDRIDYNISAGNTAEYLAWDSENSDLYVSDLNAKSVTVVNVASRAMIATIPVGTFPEGLALDAANGNVYVPNQWSRNLTIINCSTNRPIGSIVLGQPNPFYVAIDSRNGNLYIADEGSNNVSVVNLSLGRVVQNISVGGAPRSLLFDSANGYLYVSDFGGDEVSVIDGFSNRVLANITVGSGPGIASLDEANELFVPNYNSDTVSIIDTTTDKVVDTIPTEQLPWAVLHDSANDLDYIAGFQGTWVLGYAYWTPFQEVGLPSSTPWYVNVTRGPGQLSPLPSLQGSSSEVGMWLINGSYQYSVASSDKRYASQGGGLTVDGPPPTVTLSFSLVTFVETFAETGLETGAAWWVNLSAGPTGTGTGRLLSASMPNGTYAYDIGTSDKRFFARGGTFTIDGGPSNVNVTFILVTYQVSFIETGLPVGTTWNLTLGGVTRSSATSFINFSEPNGSYAYTVEFQSGFEPSVRVGQLSVNGSNVNQSVPFHSTGSSGGTLLGLPDETGLTVIAAITAGVVVLVVLSIVRDRNRRHRS